MLENEELGVVGRLYNESAILGILASQLQTVEGNTIKNKSENLLSIEETKKILELANYIENNLDQKHTIPELYEHSGLHPKKLQKGFKQLFSTTVNNFILMARMERARELIETTDLNISEIVYRLGINSRSYFSKVFTKRYGISPSEYKNLEERESPIYELSYISKPSDFVKGPEVDQIVYQSRTNNRDLNITGCLIYDYHNFIQILEGRKSRVLEVFDDIKEDNRHTKIKVTWQGLRSSRKFYKWSMAVVQVNENKKLNIENSDIELNYLLIEDLNPNTDSSKFWDKVKQELE